MAIPLFFFLLNISYTLWPMFDMWHVFLMYHKLKFQSWNCTNKIMIMKMAKWIKVAISHWTCMENELFTPQVYGFDSLAIEGSKREAWHCTCLIFYAWWSLCLLSVSGRFTETIYVPLTLDYQKQVPLLLNNLLLVVCSILMNFFLIWPFSWLKFVLTVTLPCKKAIVLTVFANISQAFSLVSRFTKCLTGIEGSSKGAKDWEKKWNLPHTFNPEIAHGLFLS